MSANETSGKLAFNVSTRNRKRVNRFKAGSYRGRPESPFNGHVSGELSDLFRGHPGLLCFDKQPDDFGILIRALPLFWCSSGSA
jgi:hypothetical protein